MPKDDQLILNRRKILAALAGGGTAALAACAPGDDRTEIDPNDLWAGFDERITERTLAEAEKLFGLAFSVAERQQILAGAVEEDDEGFFAQQIESLARRRVQDIPITLQPATRFDPRLPGVRYAEQDNSLILFPEEISAIPEDEESIAPR
jgi:hypothetical protein